MRTQTKILLFLALVTFIMFTFVVSSSLLTEVDDDAYLTPIPESTLSAYRQDSPIDSKFEAVLAANQQIHSWRLVFTQGEPQVVYAEKMNADNVRKLLNIPYEGSGNTQIWLVIFKGQWQVLPPMVDELEPIEAGCIEVIVPADKGNSYMGAGDCRALP